MPKELFMRGSRKFCQRGSNLDKGRFLVFFVIFYYYYFFFGGGVFQVDGGRADPNTTKSGSLSARQRNAEQWWTKLTVLFDDFFFRMKTAP